MVFCGNFYIVDMARVKIRLGNLTLDMTKLCYESDLYL